MGSVRRLLFGIRKRETAFEHRGFRGGTPETRRRLETVGNAFVAGYHAALDAGHPDRLEQRLATFERESIGFAFEGAAMAFALLDTISIRHRGRWRALLAGPGEPHAYMVHVGAGWAVARLGGSPERFVSPGDPLLRWLVLDGFGFHEGYFRWKRSVEGQRRPHRLAGYALRAFDQGLGRSLWFVEGAEPARIARTIAGFDADRMADLWAGVGLAAAYAGGVQESDVRALRSASGRFAPDLAQGAVFAAEARHRAGNPAPHTSIACAILCSLSAEDAARIAVLARRGLEPSVGFPDYEIWRRRIRDQFEVPRGEMPGTAAASSSNAEETAAAARHG